MTTGDHKQYKRKRRYPRVRRDELLDGHELLNDSFRATIEAQRAEIAALKFEVLRLQELAEYQRLDLMAMRGQKQMEEVD